MLGADAARLLPAIPESAASRSGRSAVRQGPRPWAVYIHRVYTQLRFDTWRPSAICFLLQACTHHAAHAQLNRLRVPLLVTCCNTRPHIVSPAAMGKFRSGPACMCTTVYRSKLVLYKRYLDHAVAISKILEPDGRCTTRRALRLSRRYMRQPMPTVPRLAGWQAA